MNLQISQRVADPSFGVAARIVVADRDDDAASLRTKLAQLGSEPIVVVVPPTNRTLESPIALRLLARAADQKGIGLAIVSRQRSLRWLARAEGLAAFGSLEEVSRARPGASPAIPGPFRRFVAELIEPCRRSLSLAVALALVFGILGALALTVPRAVVYLRPITDRLSGTVHLEASPEVTAIDVARARVPARQIYLAIETSGSIPVPVAGHALDGRAVGYVTFENRSNEAVNVPAGTSLSTFSGIHFQTTRGVVLAPHPGATAEVPIVATAPGEFANVLRGQITLIDGRLRWLIVAVNEDNLAGGGPGGTPVVTAWERNQLLADVLARARQLAHQKVAQLVDQDELAIPESIEVTPIDETFDHQIGDQARELSVKVESRVRALIVNQRSVDQLATQLWHPSIRPGFTVQPRSVVVGAPTVTRISPSGVELDVPLQATAYARVNVERVAPYVRLRAPSVAEQSLARDFPLAAPPRIEIVPRWLPRAYRVEVIVDPSASASAGASDR